MDALVQGPLNSLLAKAGINLTASLEAAAQTTLWDERIPLIHDDNFDEVIVHEQLTSEEEKDRLWSLLMCVVSVRSCFGLLR